MPRVRQQLSLYVDPAASSDIEAVRRRLDPIQSSLILAHVTLCRADELGDLPAIVQRLERAPAVTLRFGRAEAFSTHGVLLRCIEGAHRFQALREAVLGSTMIKPLPPHLTLAHPRNPKAAGNSVEAAWSLPSPLELTFGVVRLIEQIADAPWRALETFTLVPFLS